MKYRPTTWKCKLFSFFVLAWPLTMFGQAPSEYPYQVSYASNLNLGDSVVNVTNNGASAGGNTPIVNANSYGVICVNIYVYAPDQEQATCCTCLVSPNSLHSFAVSYGPGNLLESASAIGAVLNIRSTNSLTVHLLATVADGIPGTPSCRRPDTPAAPTVGLVAWGTHTHPTNTTQAAITETAFTPGPAASGELARLTSDCGFNLTRGSQPQCPGCRLGGLATPSF